jgi:hypothetical protein
MRMLGVPFHAVRELAHAPLPSRSCPNPADLRDPSAHTGPQPTLGRLCPPPSSPLDRCPRCSASLRRSARRDDGNAPDHGKWRVATDRLSRRRRAGSTMRVLNPILPQLVHRLVVHSTTAGGGPRAAARW